jgi:hypothetical protein
MRDPPVDSNPYRSAADRARDAWIHVPIEDRYQAGMRIAADVRQARATAAARDAIELAGQLAASENMPANIPADPAWEVRGEPRTRATFGRPHPADFRGGLPIPAECPEVS